MKIPALSETDQKRLAAIKVKERLNKDDIVTLISLKLRREEGASAPTKEDVEKICMEFLNAITRNVYDGKRVLITGFGSFAPEIRAARMARNPQTGEAVQAPAIKNVKFSSATLFKQYLNGRPLPPKGDLVGKAAKNSGKATGDFAKAGVRKRKYILKEKV
jgi:nucleoid DNA-binding protein